MNRQQRSTNPLVPQDGLLDVRVSQNYGYHFEDPYSQDNNILGSIYWGALYRETTMSPKLQELLIARRKQVMLIFGVASTQLDATDFKPTDLSFATFLR